MLSKRNIKQKLWSHERGRWRSRMEELQSIKWRYIEMLTDLQPSCLSEHIASFISVSLKIWFFTNTTNNLVINAILWNEKMWIKKKKKTLNRIQGYRKGIPRIGMHFYSSWNPKSGEYWLEIWIEVGWLQTLTSCSGQVYNLRYRILQTSFSTTVNVLLHYDVKAGLRTTARAFVQSSLPIRPLAFVNRDLLFPWNPYHCHCSSSCSAVAM